MNFEQQEIARRQSNIEHYKRSARLRAYCCGCIYSEANTVLVCFFWAAISFYFAILAFMNKSPFYSYLHDAPTVVFGALNLAFGIVNLCSMAVFLIRANTINKMMRMQFGPMLQTFSASPLMVLVITANALGVLIATIVNYVLFVEDRDGFNTWCLENGANRVQQAFITGQSSNMTDTTISNLSNALKTANISLYNCNRLFDDEVKWALFCTILMVVIYTHWILIIAAKQSYNFYRRAPVLNMNEFGNIPPSSFAATGRDRKKLNTLLRSGRPAKSYLEDFIVHKQLGEFCAENEQDTYSFVNDAQIHQLNMPDESLNVLNIPEKAVLP